MVALLRDISPHDRGLCSLFEEIIMAGASGKLFSLDHNPEWSRHTRPMVEAFLHARHMLSMVVKYGHEFDDPPQWLPYGWATVLTLYGLR